MKTIVYKAFVYLFLSFQMLVVLHALPSQYSFKSYTAEVFTRILFSITKVNHMYNFFTDPLKTGKYSYTTNSMMLIKSQEDQIIDKVLTKDGSIKSAVSKVNQARVSHIQSLATRDTSFYNAIVRSQALFFMDNHPEYPLFSVEVLQHNCQAIRRGNRFTKIEQVDTIYTNLFAVE